METEFQLIAITEQLLENKEKIGLEWSFRKQLGLEGAFDYLIKVFGQYGSIYISMRLEITPQKFFRQISVLSGQKLKKPNIFESNKKIIFLTTC